MSPLTQTRIASIGIVAFLAIFAASIGAQAAFGSGFMPHGFCLTWIPGLLWLHVISDSLIALAYMSIPLTLAYFVRHRRDLPFSWVFVLFGLFIVACGMTHVFDVWTIWHPDYWLSGGVKAITAAASVPTAIALMLLVPKALAIPSVQQLRDANEALRLEIAARRQVEEKLEASRAELRTVVSERTAELNKTTALLDAFFESSPLGLAVFDSKLRFVKVNDQLARLDRLPIENHLGRTFPEVDADVAPSVMAALAEVRSGSARVVQLEIDGKDDEESMPTTWRITVHVVPKTKSDPLIGYACEVIRRVVS